MFDTSDLHGEELVLTLRARALKLGKPKETREIHHPVQDVQAFEDQGDVG